MRESPGRTDVSMNMKTGVRFSLATRLVVMNRSSPSNAISMSARRRQCSHQVSMNSLRERSWRAAGLVARRSAFCSASFWVAFSGWAGLRGGDAP